MGVCQVAMGGKAKEGFQQKRPLECWEAMGRFGERKLQSCGCWSELMSLVNKG